MLNLNFLQMKKWKLILVKLFSDGIRVLTFLQRKNLALRFDQTSESNFVYWNLFSNYLFWKILHLKSRKNQDYKRRLRWEHLWSFSLLWWLITEFCLTIGHFFLDEIFNIKFFKQKSKLLVICKKNLNLFSPSKLKLLFS
jgi:hypothetical protein